MMEVVRTMELGGEEEDGSCWLDDPSHGTAMPALSLSPESRPFSFSEKY